MQDGQHDDNPPALLERSAVRAFVQVETYVYMALGVLLVLTTMIGIASAGESVWNSFRAYGSPDALVATIDRLLLVVMLVEILHTVRVSFSSGTLQCEPFLIVGLVASIRRVLVITLKSSQAPSATISPADAAATFNSTMLELIVLGGLILVMVVSIYLLRRAGSGGRVAQAGRQISR